jgi:hypothetical protein
VSLATLRVHARLLPTDISGIEARHASIRRRLTARGVQTWALDLPECSAEFVCSQARSMGRSDLAEVAAQVSQNNDASEEAECGSAATTTRRPGGGWRAFVRARSLGAAGGLLDMADLARQYRELSPEELAHYKRVGRAATENPNEGRGSSFGLRGRDVQRVQAARRQQAASDALVPVLGDGRQLTSGEQCGAAVTQVCSRRSAAPLSQMLVDARAILATSRRAQARVHEQAEQRLSEWHEECGPQIRSLVTQSVPTLRGFMPNFGSVPSASDMILEYRPSLLAAASVATAASKHARSSNVAKALDSDWVAKHRCIMHDSVPPIADEPKQIWSPHNLCASVGFCIGDHEGQLFERMRAQVYKQLKQHSKPKSPGHPEGCVNLERN